MTLFVSIFGYAWAKNGGSLSVSLAAGEKSTTPAFRTLHRLRKRHETVLCLETSTLIARARCRAAGAFLASELPLWLSIDEDVDATDDALEELLDVADARNGTLAVAAMRLRSDDKRFNVEALDQAARPQHHDALPIRRGGVALSAMPRELVDDVAFKTCPWFTEEVPPMGRTRCPALFLERVEADAWMGEDVAFCDRARAAGVPLVALFHQGVTHAGLSNAELLT